MINYFQGITRENINVKYKNCFPEEFRDCFVDMLTKKLRNPMGKQIFHNILCSLHVIRLIHLVDGVASLLKEAVYFGDSNLHIIDNRQFYSTPLV